MTKREASGPPGRKPRFAVTGANGYVGSSLCAYLRHRGFAVVELRHDLMRSGESDRYGISYALDRDVQPDVFGDIDVVVHCAYDFTLTKWSDIFDVNVGGASRLFHAARKAGVGKLICVSTMSAFDGCRSLYGQAKLEIERELSKVGGIIIRPGLVYGPNAGGMIGSLEKIVSHWPVAPLVGSGSQTLHLVHVDDLSELILNAARHDGDDLSVPLIAASDQGKSLRTILTELAGARGRKIWLIPVPWRVLWLVFWVAELAHLPLGFRSDSVIGLVHQDPKPNFARAKKIGSHCREFMGATFQ